MKFALRKLAGLTLCLVTSFSLVQANETVSEIVQGAEQGFAETFKAAVDHDPQFKRAYWTHQSELEESELGFSALLPDVRLSASYQYEDSDNIYTDPEGLYEPGEARSSGKLVDSYFRVTLRQPLYNAAAYEAYKRSKVTVEASGYRYQRSEQELIYRVTERYLQVLLSAQQVFLNQQKLDALELKMDQAQRARELGVGDQLQVLHVKSNRDLARSDLLQAKSQLNDAQTLLNNLTGTEVNLPADWVESSDTISPDFLAGTEEDWLQNVINNFSVKDAQARIIQERHNLASSKGEHKPTLNFSLSYLDRESEDEFRSRKDAIAAIELSVPLYSGGGTQASVRKARAKLKASEAEYGYVVAEKEQQIKLSYNRMISFKDRLLALAESRESSKGFLEAAERELSLNVSDQANVLDARTQLVDTRLQIAQTLNDYLLSDLILRLEAGQLNQNRLRDYDQLFNSASVTK